MTISALLFCWNTSTGKQDAFDPKPFRFRIVLNDATQGELQTLPGIGPKLAEKIVQYRDEHYPMQHYDEILNVSGIGPKRYSALKPYFAE